MCSSNTNVVRAARDQMGRSCSTHRKLIANIMFEPGTCEAETETFHLAGLAQVGCSPSDCWGCGGNSWSWRKPVERDCSGCVRERELSQLPEGLGSSETNLRPVIHTTSGRMT